LGKKSFKALSDNSEKISNQAPQMGKKGNLMLFIALGHITAQIYVDLTL
jgi:hypothetical protein